MARVEKYVCDICGSQRAGIMSMPPGDLHPRRQLDVCQKCIDKLNHLTRTPDGKALLRSIQLPLNPNLRR
jgi:hypothetical protein